MHFKKYIFENINHKKIKLANMIIKTHRKLGKIETEIMDVEKDVYGYHLSETSRGTIYPV